MDLPSWMGGKRTDPVSRAIDDAIDLLDKKQYDDAIAVIRDRALSRDAENPRALLHLGICHMLKKEYDTAEEILRPIAAKKPMDSEVAAAKIAMEKIAKDRGKPT